MTKKQLIRTIFYGATIILILVFASKYNTTRKEINRLKGIKAELLEERKNLDQKLLRLKYDIKHANTYEFIEKSAREKGMIKPREILIIDLDKDKESPK